jgi:hypothetical protein
MKAADEWRFQFGDSSSAPGLLADEAEAARAAMGRRVISPPLFFFFMDNH